MHYVSIHVQLPNRPLNPWIPYATTMLHTRLSFSYETPKVSLSSRFPSTSTMQQQTTIRKENPVFGRTEKKNQPGPAKLVGCRVSGIFRVMLYDARRYVTPLPI